MPVQMNYSDHDLEELLSDIESDRTERKESWAGDASDRARQAVCAFANDLPDHKQPGVLFVGAKDNGTPSGLQITDQLLLTLSDIKTDGQMLPPTTITVANTRVKSNNYSGLGQKKAEPPTQSPTQSTDSVTKLMMALKTGELSASELRDKLKIKHRHTFRTNYLRPALENGLIEQTLPDKPNSRLQKYRLTEKGRKMVEGKR